MKSKNVLLKKIISIQMLVNLDFIRENEQNRVLWYMEPGKAKSHTKATCVVSSDKTTEKIGTHEGYKSMTSISSRLLHAT